MQHFSKTEQHVPPSENWCLGLHTLSWFGRGPRLTEGLFGDHHPPNLAIIRSLFSHVWDSEASLVVRMEWRGRKRSLSLFAHIDRAQPCKVLKSVSLIEHLTELYSLSLHMTSLSDWITCNKDKILPCVHPHQFYSTKSIHVQWQAKICNEQLSLNTRTPTTSL